MASRNGSRQAALVRARERRRELDRDRDAQDQRIEEATAEAFVALDTRGEAQEAVAAATAQLGIAVRKLLAEDVTAEKAAALLELDMAEVRRLSKATPATPGRRDRARASEAAVRTRPPSSNEDEDAPRRAG
jgi:hypothetical protein